MSFWTFLYAFCALPCIISHFYVSQEQEQVNFCCQKFFVLLRFGSVVHPCCYKLSKVLSLFNDNIYKAHIISYSKSYITSMIINTEGSEFFFFFKPKILHLSMTAMLFLCVFIELTLKHKAQSKLFRSYTFQDFKVSTQKHSHKMCPPKKWRRRNGKG